MRDTQRIITTDPRYSTFTGPCGKYGKLTFNSPIAAMEFHRKLFKGVGERAVDRTSSWRLTDASGAGLGNQSLADYDASHIAREAMDAVMQAEAKMPHKLTRLASPHMAVTGGYWDTPSVLANLPLAARTRKRAKLAPLNLRIGFFFSAGISAKSMAPHCAKLTRAIWDYVIAGGSVSLTMFHCEGPERGNNEGTGTNGLIVETRINTSDLASLSLALSPVYMRLTVFDIQSAHSDRGSGIPFPSTCPVPNCLFVGGRLDEVFSAVAKVCKQLEIT